MKGWANNSDDLGQFVAWYCVKHDYTADRGKEDCCPYCKKDASKPQGEERTK